MKSPEGAAPARYPYGKLNDEDEGEIPLKIGSDRATETVIMDFGHAVTWIGMRPEQAQRIAELLLKHAERVRR